MTLLKLLSWPYVRRHKLRTVLTVAGIALGVMVYTGMRAANDAVLNGFQQTVDRIAGRAQLQITAGEAGFPEEVLAGVQTLSEVAAAAPLIEAVVPTGLPGEGNLLLLAVDMTADRSLRDYQFEAGEELVIEDPLVFLAQPDSVIVTRDFARRHGLVTGSMLKLETMEGPKQLTIRGIMQPGGLAGAFGGALAIMDIYAAQKMLGRGRTFDRIDIRIQEGVPLERARQAIRAKLGPGFQVEPPANRGKQFESIARLFSLGANLNSAFALLIGLFLINNTFAVAVAQRRSEIGILRALGASRGQIRNLFLAESAVLGVAGSLGGVAAGLLLARAMAGYLSDYLNTIYGVAQQAEAIALDWGLLAFALGAGVSASVIAAWIPAREAARIDPVQALHKAAHEASFERANRSRMFAATVLVAMAAACALIREGTAVRLYAGYFSLIVAAILLTPALVQTLVRLLRPLLRRLLPVEGVLAADSLLQSPRRTSSTVAAVMLALSLVIGLGGIAAASYRSILQWMNATLNPDLFVGSSPQISNRSFRFPASMGKELEQLDGVDEVQMVRTARVIYRGRPILLVAGELSRLERRVRPQVVAGDLNTMYRRAATGEGVIISDNLALLEKLRLGDVIEIGSPSGLLRLPVLGVSIDYSDQQGAILMDRAVFIRHWKDDSVNLFRVYLRPGVRPEQAKRRILERFGTHKRLFIMTNAQLRAYIERVTDQWFALTYLQICVAVLVAVLGIVNSLTVSITDRRRELGILQAVGGLRRQVRRAVWTEAAGIGLLSLALGLALGALILFYYLEALREDLAGMRLDYHYPTRIALWMVPTLMAAAWLAALAPAESAVRGSLLEALEYE